MSISNLIIPTYKKLKKYIDELIIYHVMIQFLNDETLKPSPKLWFKTKNINSEEFKSVFKSMILKHIRQFLKSLFPFDRYDPNITIIRQETPLGKIINNN